MGIGDYSASCIFHFMLPTLNEVAFLGSLGVSCGPWKCNSRCKGRKYDRNGDLLPCQVKRARCTFLNTKHSGQGPGEQAFQGRLRDGSTLYSVSTDPPSKRRPFIDLELVSPPDDSPRAELEEDVWKRNARHLGVGLRTQENHLECCLVDLFKRSHSFVSAHLFD